MPLDFGVPAGKQVVVLAGAGIIKLLNLPDVLSESAGLVHEQILLSCREKCAVSLPAPRQLCSLLQWIHAQLPLHAPCTDELSMWSGLTHSEMAAACCA